MVSLLREVDKATVSDALLCLVEVFGRRLVAEVMCDLICGDTGRHAEMPADAPASIMEDAIYRVRGYYAAHKKALPTPF